MGELEDALQAADVGAARRLSLGVVGTDRLDDTLALLARYGRQDPAAVDLLVEVLDASGTIRRFARAALLDHAAVDDVSQDSLISIAASIGSYDGRGKVTTWVHSIVRRRVVDHLRRQRATAPLTDEAVEAAPGPRMSSLIATRASVQAALEALPELYRLPVVMRDLEGQAYADISQALGRPTGTVKAQISRGRAMVAARLRGEGGGLGV